MLDPERGICGSPFGLGPKYIGSTPVALIFFDLTVV